MTIYQKWYSNETIKKAICRSMLNREMMLIDKSNPNNIIRRLKCHEPKYFDHIFNFQGVYEKGILYNIYYSLAKYKTGIKIRSEASDQDWITNHHKEMVSYDFVIDIDADEGELQYAWESTKNLIKSIDNKYEVRFSGRGFHVFIALDFVYIPFNPDEDNNIYKYYHQLAKKYHDTISEMIDLSIYDSRRVIKAPFSLAVYSADKPPVICCPLTLSELDTFLDDYDKGKYFLNDSNFDEWVRRAEKWINCGTD